MVKLLTLVIKGYQKYLSPLFGALLGGACRFNPTCSDYSIEALEKYGLIKGSVFSVRRILKCNPFTKAGFDPIPD